ncbi:MAG: hypothetical protein IIC24_06430, partial [Chloroflexi bacterium]|nr:hypothetical protein [Chloroflexota bacterium]
MPSIQLSECAGCDLRLLAMGGFSPLDRFMSQPDFQSVLDTMRTANGTLFPIPITLAVNAGETFARLKFQAISEGTPSGEFQPIRWRWSDCGDNAIANSIGDTTFLSRRVYSHITDPNQGLRMDITDFNAMLPSESGVPSSCIGQDIISPPIRYVDYFN